MHLLTGAGQRGPTAYTEHLRVRDLSVGTYVPGPAQHCRGEGAR